MNEAVSQHENEPRNDPQNRLESWKEIAAYLNRGVRTVQRWERTEGLPVYRHVHGKRGTVYAFRHEIDDWREARKGSAAAAAPDTPAPRATWTAAGQRAFGMLGAWLESLARRLGPADRRKRLAVRIALILTVLV